MQQLTRIGLAVVAGSLFAGCVDESISAEAEVRTTEQSVEVSNGISLNGISLNGISLNGISLNGISLNGISLNGISLNGISLNGISLNGISLNGISLNGISLNGSDLQSVVGATWTGMLSNGSTLPLRIDSATTGTGTNSDVGMFGVSYQVDGGWQRLCGDNADGSPTLAVIVPGTWDLQNGDYTPSSSLVSFACRGKTIAKCVELGYKPWNLLTPHMTSCVRLLRADYCGDGVSYTQDGTRLNLYDNVGVQLDTEKWDREAEWTPDGARCISTSRHSRFIQSGAVPSCISNGSVRVNATCGTFLQGALLVSELPR